MTIQQSSATLTLRSFVTPLNPVTKARRQHVDKHDVDLLAAT